MGLHRQTLRSAFLALSVVITSALLVGCASVQIDTARAEWQAGNSQQAIASLSTDKIPVRDHLLAHMEKGLIQHETGDYNGSINTLLKAVKLLNSRDFLSVSELGGSLVISERATTYKGEYAEQLWLHTYLMMNFLLAEQYESAAVEARRALKVFDNHSDILQHDHFSQLLTAIAFNSAGQTNDAYVTYRNLAALVPESSAVAGALSNIAASLGQFSEAEKYRKISGPSSRNDSGELVVFVASGTIAQKRPGDLFVFPDARISFPFYPPTFRTVPTIAVEAGGATRDTSTLSTSLNALVAESLAARGNKLAAKQVARLAAKNALAESASSDTATEILKAVLFVLEEADTRSWQTLPADLTMVRVPLPPGSHNVILRATHLGERDITFSVDIQPGKSTFRRWRLSG